MVEHPGRQGDGRIQQGVSDGLRPGGLLEEVAVAAGLHCGDRGQRRPLLLGGFRWRRAEQRNLEQVEVDAEQPGGSLAGHLVGDKGTEIAALGDEAVIAEPAHQLRPGAGDAPGVPADLRGFGGEAETGQGGEHQVERVPGGTAVRGGIAERAHHAEQLDDRAGPAVRDN